MNKKILVTGGAGFIGSWLCEELLNRRNKVICMDNLLTGSEKNILHLKKNKDFKFIKHDVVSPFKISNLNYIFHLASPASPPLYPKIPLETSFPNSFGTLNMLRLAVKNRARFLFTSTSEIYGDPLKHPQREDYWGNVNTVGIRSAYDESKRFGETLTYIYLKKYGLDVRVARIFNTYGPRMDKNDGRVVSNFINQALENKSLTIYGDGKQTRSFCYVSDMIAGLVKLMLKENISGEIINLGNPREKTILEIARTIKKITNSKSPLSYESLPEDDPKRRCPSIEKAKKILNWHPKVSLKQGLSKTIRWYKESR